MVTSEEIVQKKICLIGDFAIGKTSLVRRFLFNLFDDRYLNTIGVNISRKEISLADGPTMRLIIWDLSSSEKFERNRSDYLHGTAGAFLVCDLTRADTVAMLDNYFAPQLFKSNPAAKAIVVGNKSDLVAPDCETILQVQRYAAELKAPCHITSAKTGEGVETAFLQLAEMLYENG